MQIFSLLCLAFTFARAALINHTIDDSGVDEVTGLQPAYFPATAWRQCPGSCFINDDNDTTGPDAEAAFANNRTWHENLNSDEANTTITLTFTGTAVYVYWMLFAYSPSSVTFYLDGKNQVGVYNHPGEQNPLKGPTFYYQVLVYANSSLPNGQHSLVMENWKGSLGLFDYAVYTTDDSANSTSSANPSTTSAATASSTTNVGLIAGVTVAGVVTLLALGGFFYYRRRLRHLKRFEDSPPSTQQFLSPYGTAEPFTAAYSASTVAEHMRTQSAGATASPFSSAPQLATQVQKMPITHLAPPLHTDSGFRSTHGIPPLYTEA